MKSLSKEQETLHEGNVQAFLQNKHAVLEHEVQGLKRPIDPESFMIALAFVPAGVFALSVAREGHFLSDWVGLTVAVGIMLVLPFGLIGNWYSQHSLKRLQEQKRIQLLRELNDDPLSARAHLIVQTAKEYRAHLAMYKAWQKLVAEKLEPPDEELDDRYHTFITRTHASLQEAIKSWNRVASFRQWQGRFLAEHPELGASTNETALVDLVEKLGQPIEMMPELAVTGLLASFEHEDAVATLNSELRGSDPEKKD